MPKGIARKKQVFKTPMPPSGSLPVGMRQVFGETPTGTGDTYGLDHEPIPMSVEFVVNGVYLKRDAAEGGFSVLGSIVTTTEEYEGATIIANYRW